MVRKRLLVGVLVAATFGTSGAGATATEVAADGTRHNGLIVFMRPGSAGEYDLWVMRPDGTRLRRLTHSPRGFADYNPDWSPDGLRVLFERRGGDGDDLWTVDAATGRLSRVTDCRDECWSNNEARWSADGTKIAFGRATGPRDQPGPAQVAVYVMGADGGGITQLSRPPQGYEDHYPTWSPDSKTVVFQRDTSTNRAAGTSLIAVDPTTGVERRLYTLPSWAYGGGIASFSPDGRRILFSFWCIYGDDCPPSTRNARNARLATIRADGTGLSVLRLKARGDSGAWSPDGTRIVFRCQPSTGPAIGDFRLCTSKPNGTQLKRFPWGLDSAHPSWGTHP